MNELPTTFERSAGRGSLHEVLCHVRMFKPQFAPLVESGAKCQTVRPTPKRMPKPGDRISLRVWTGKPYRSKQRILREATITEVQTVRMTDSDMWLDGVRQTGNQNWEFALADGFKSSLEMCDWFADTHGLPFEGVVIKWHNKRVLHSHEFAKEQLRL